MAITEAKPTSPIWRVRDRNEPAEGHLMRELGISSLLASVLCQRGWTEPAAAYNFLHPDLNDLGDPATLPDYEPAVKAILNARETKDLIFVHGDYDVDGVTSAAILHRFLGRIGCNIHTHVPHRIKEGYGIHTDAVDRAHSLGAKLFLTCDCGIAAHDQVRKARALGMKVVVTDHHEIADQIPEAEAVINPHRKDSRYPESELSGAGVVFRLCEGLTRELNFPVDKYREAFLDLACLGTIADVMPLIGENRIIAKFGLERLAKTKKVGLQALMREANVGQDPTKPVISYNVGWHLGPRLNAVGRIEDASTALQLLIETDVEKASVLAKQLEDVNAERRARTSAIVDQAVEMVLENGYQNSSMIVVADPSWHSGIVGIVAGRLVERFTRPALVMSVNQATGLCRGSARSISNFHLANAIWAFPELLQGGGHAMAAGCSFDLEKLDVVRENLDNYAKQHLDPEDLIPKVYVDLEIRPDELSIKSIEELKLMEPYGCANPEPLFLARNCEITDLLPTRNPIHVRVKFLDSSRQKGNGIAFNLGESLGQFQVGDPIDFLFKPEINEYRGSRSPQWSIKSHRVPFHSL